MINKLRDVRETNGLELDLEETEPTIGGKFKTKLFSCYHSLRVDFYTIYV